MKNTIYYNITIGVVPLKGEAHNSDILISKYQLHLFSQGENFYSYRMLGAHMFSEQGKTLVRFAVWAPNAVSVSVVGDFNSWDGNKNVMEQLETSGVWYTVIEEICELDIYKYEIHTKDGNVLLKTDPYGFYSEVRPGNASRVISLEDYRWGDDEWMNARAEGNPLKKPLSIYEVHLGSWKQHDDGSFLTYRELADELVDYVCDMGYTHLELLPITEYPFDGSWGYQVTGYFAATSRFGDPKDFMYFIEKCHKRGIGVILDWVPAHFPKDANGLARFDGTALYEYEDSRLGEHKEWGTYVFNYKINEVISFLISSAMFWLDVYHIDGLRVDAVSSMLYLDYMRRGGEWVQNRFGGRENLEAVDFIKKLNEAVYTDFPNILMIAEESTSWPMVTKPPYTGGLGFSYKWNMGWMHDILDYMSLDPLFRKGSHDKLTFSMMYAFSENYILPFSHDEVVHGKKSLIGRIPGEYTEKFSNLRLLYGYMMAHPGKKLIFMGGEFGQFIEWRFYSGLDWHLLNYDSHSKLQLFVKDLNHLYRKEKALWQNDASWEGFNWINPDDSGRSVLSFIRKGENDEDDIIAVCNFTPVTLENYIIGVPYSGEYTEVLNSDDLIYGGSGVLNEKRIAAQKLPWTSFPCSLSIKIPPLAVIYLKCARKFEEDINNK